jgi:hypothetical protein
MSDKLIGGPLKAFPNRPLQVILYPNSLLFRRGFLARSLVLEHSKHKPKSEVGTFDGKVLHVGVAICRPLRVRLLAWAALLSN